ncbi:MBL fold metallo-hydrolase [Acinetobacter junii]|jgi:L-ascorbate metabolism protein UlaG (beta-lactamase superfamily)|uniref:MBL fold metallo-hydrolase n=1 Tax=Acinetobacter junii TaxID=40215 RepID=UPI0005B445D0|nr:MBL fold metallo-hydrolase [Acinetobacter junii]MBL8282120.1 MBL fold metallo-hydrolase [Acinetobacter junii]MDH1005461.1 MBL fold metallo-hydrolase [Acinetobacter junii]MQZ56936.1 MBL fold metallo-hydrolase [Acinetobacter junii]QQV65847.1 Metallo-beta-lactamase domain protein [Acinetobacter junii]QXR26717.1 MBL fold metallo-hydrolase [Acinetobacter junii]
MLILFAIVVLLLLGISILYTQHPLFGKIPTGERLKRIENSPNYRQGQFRNRLEKPDMADCSHTFIELYRTFIKTIPHRRPKDIIPSIKTNLRTLDPKQDVMIWFGHSSVFIQLNGKTFLIDPVMSGKVSPLPWGTRAYRGTDIYTVEELPEIDYLLISHDHYDHLDYKTILQLKDKVKYVITGLGVGEHFEYWGYSKEQLIERDWGDKIEFEGGITIITETTHHDSRRAFKGGKNLWVSFIIQSPNRKIFYTGDGGYDKHFVEIGKKYGPFDWALMENGQYDAAWRSVHCHPDEVAQATEELQARNMLPVHHSKFSLAKHPWNEPINRIVRYSKQRNYRLATPMIGELVELDNEQQSFKQWWANIR